MQNIEYSLLRELNLYMTILRTAAVDPLTSAVATSHLLWYQAIQQTFSEPQLWVTPREDRIWLDCLSLQGMSIFLACISQRELIGIN